jgi:hypothetical protein
VLWIARHLLRPGAVELLLARHDLLHLLLVLLIRCILMLLLAILLALIVVLLAVLGLLPGLLVTCHSAPLVRQLESWFSSSNYTKSNKIRMLVYSQQHF